MRVVVVGGTGLIGSKVIAQLTERGHEGVAASAGTGVGTVAGAGLYRVVRGADAVLDVTDAPSREDGAVHDFLVTSTRHQLVAEVAAGVPMHVALSIVGAHRVPDSGYLRAKVAQEHVLEESGHPYSIVRSTQLFELLGDMVEAGADGKVVRLTDALIQPIAADDVARLLTDTVLDTPANATLEIGGPEAIALDELGRRILAHDRDPRPVVTDPEARCFGARVPHRSLTTGPAARLGEIRFDDWLANSSPTAR